MRRKERGIFSELVRWILSILLLPLFVYWAANRGEYFFLDWINLFIHEAGHLLFYFLGRFLYTAGGTILQLLIPFSLVFFYWRRENLYITQIFLAWLGESFINVSVYAADAQEQDLPLVGGSSVYHDWNYMLTKLEILQYDNEVGLAFFGCGLLVFLICFFAPLFIDRYQSSNIILDI